MSLRHALTHVFVGVKRLVEVVGTQGESQKQKAPSHSHLGEFLLVLVLVNFKLRVENFELLRVLQRLVDPHYRRANHADHHEKVEAEQAG